MKNKFTIHLMSAALCLSLPACAPETVESGDEQRLPVTVGFAARSYSSASTRGEMIVDASGLASAGGFEAWTYFYSGTWAGTAVADLLVGNAASMGSTIDHAHVTSPDGSDGSWDHGTQSVFWPEGKMVSSFAIAPTDADGVVVNAPSTDRIPEVTCTLPQPGSNRVDLLFAEAIIGLTANATNGRIVERFSHAMSRVSFHAFKEPSLAGKEVRVTSVRLIDIYESGTAPLTTPVVWTVAGNPTTLEFTTTNGRLAGEAVTATSIDSADALLSSAMGKLFMLPQPLSGDQLEVVYTIDGEVVVKTLPIPLPAGEQGWEPGRSYSIFMGLLEADIIVEPKTFNESESFTIPVTGYYYVEAWGADGGHGGNATTTQGRGGAGSYQSGLYYFNKGQTIQVQVGERGGNGARAEVGADISRGAGGKALVAGGATAAWFGAGGSGGAGGDNRSGNSAFRGGGGGGGGAASGILSGGEVHLAASGGGGGGGRTGYTVGSMSGGNSNGGGNGTNPGDGTKFNNELIPRGGTIATPAQQNGGGVPGESTHTPTWPGGGGGGGGGGYARGGYGGHGSNGYGSAAGGAGGSNWAGGTHHKPASSTDVPSEIRQAVVNIAPLSRTSNGNGVVRITPVGF